ncbi:MAG: hypothetical protein EOM20_13770 [Spartobacteria bacterium]|nr:hypothetical protein [Spartobacteria bacterium]
MNNRFAGIILAAILLMGHPGEGLAADETIRIDHVPVTVTRRAVARLLYPDAFVKLEGGRFRKGRLSPTGKRPEVVKVEGFYIAACEITVETYVAFLNATRRMGAPEYGQYAVQGGRVFALPGQENLPAAHVSYDEACDFCRWLTGLWALDVRLPTETEWEYAARGGIEAAPYPWGWGTPRGRACFDTDGVVPVDALPPNPYGLYQMAGNVFEWCKPDEYARDQAVVRGGSWSERSPSILHVANRVLLPVSYRGADVGFRVIVPLATD